MELSGADNLSSQVGRREKRMSIPLTALGTSKEVEHKKRDAGMIRNLQRHVQMRAVKRDRSIRQSTALLFITVKNISRIQDVVLDMLSSKTQCDLPNRLITLTVPFLSSCLVTVLSLCHGFQVQTNTSKDGKRGLEKNP